MRIDLASVGSAPDGPNEDYVAMAVPAIGFGGVVLVLDGVTPPPDGRTGCVHTVPWFTTHLGGALLDLAGTRRELDLAGCLAEAIARTAAAHGPDCDLAHVRTPQATVAAMRWDAENVEYLVLSDAVAVLESTDGTVTPVLDDSIDVMVRRPEIHALRENKRALPTGSAEYAEVTSELGRVVDALRNADGGFFTAAADPDVAGRAVTGSRPRADVRAAAVITDGATRFSEVFRLGDWTALLDVLEHEGVQALIDRVRAEEAADPDGAAFPRGKQFDDASGVYVRF